MAVIDLHSHSFYSDGQDSPKEISSKMSKAGVSLFSITDHNYIHPNLVGLTGTPRFIQGIEISSIDRKTGSSIHVLGYSKNFDVKKINQALFRVVDGYNDRAKLIIKKINDKFGYDFNFDEIKKNIPSVCVSRNLIAQMLLEFSGDGITMSEAVKECFVKEDDSWMPDTEDAVKLISDCGGVAVMAHPGRLLKNINLDALVARLISVGLRGIETYYPYHDEQTIKNLENIALANNLFVTAGSDWHGSSFSKFNVGMDVSDSVYQNIINQFK